MINKAAMRKDLIKLVDQYIKEGMPEEERVKAYKLLKAIKEGKAKEPKQIKE